MPLGLLAVRRRRALDGRASRWRRWRGWPARTRTIDVTNLQQRLPVRGADDELDDVALAFNDTLARLEQAVGEMRQFSAALAHELRTPLAALRGEIELALRDARTAEDVAPRGWPASSRSSTSCSG